MFKGGKKWYTYTPPPKKIPCDLLVLNQELVSALFADSADTASPSAHNFLQICQ